MPLSDKKRASNLKYDKTHLFRTSIAFQNDLNDVLQKCLEEKHCTRNSYIVDAIREKLERDGYKVPDKKSGF